MPKRVAAEKKRVSLNCLVLPETLAWLKSREFSQGTAVDLAVAALRVQEGQEAQERLPAGPFDFTITREKASSKFVKRGPRPKGGKSR